MTLFKLKTTTTILIEEDYNKNSLTLLQNLIQDDHMLNVYCFEQPIALWKNIFKDKLCQFYSEIYPEKLERPKEKTTILIDSVNQMALLLGWNNCLKIIKNFQHDSNVLKLIIVLHKDCILLNSKMQIHLNHIAHAIVTFDTKRNDKLNIQIKKAGKLVKSEEIVSYDSRTGYFKLSPIVKLSKKDEVQKVTPGSLTTFKIETDQISQLEKNKLQLPYMSKINEGQGRVFYEPDAVDDWDDEDPDDDLDI